MVLALSVDTRIRVAKALEEGETVRAAAKRFGISVASAVRIGQRQRAGRAARFPARLEGAAARRSLAKVGTGCWPGWPRSPI